MASIILSVKLSEDSEGDNIYDLMKSIQGYCFASAGPTFMYKLTPDAYHAFLARFNNLMPTEKKFLEIEFDDK